MNDGGYWEAAVESLRRIPRPTRSFGLMLQIPPCQVASQGVSVHVIYGVLDGHAQTIFTEEVPAGALDIQIFAADNTAYSKKLNRVVMMRDAPDHSPDDFVQLSGTKVRDMLAAGQDLPLEFARPEVARILMAYYQEEAKG